MSRIPPHHRAGGGFVNPWLSEQRSRFDLLRWAWQRRRTPLAPDPPARSLPRATSSIAHPHAGPGELCITWIGHATFLIQVEGWNVLTDPHWGTRASPVKWAGPMRFSLPGVAFDDLPPIDAVLLSHDHYDHLDEGTVSRIAARWPEATWYVPLGYEQWLAARGVERLASLDWWQEATSTSSGALLRVVALPAQHWTSRSPFDRQRRLWASWALLSSGGRSVYFAGDTGYCALFREIGRRLGTFDAALMPIGAYEPRWFMAAAHMNPEEAVAAFNDLGGQGTFVGMHWGTWRLTDEDPLEPPVRTRAAWTASGLDPQRLWIPAHGETRHFPA